MKKKLRKPLGNPYFLRGFIVLFSCVGFSLAGCQQTNKTTANVKWISTTQTDTWKSEKVDSVSMPVANAEKVVVYQDSLLQKIDGFGGCFNELGWQALEKLPEAQRKAIFSELFAPGKGADFNLCRMPLGANDFSLDWYSYDEHADDFGLKNFSIAHDQKTLIPFIKSALNVNPELRLWASPWSPPTWMKKNGHYAMAAVPSLIKGVDNGIRPDQVMHEGEDAFKLEKPYLKAYASYFADFIKAYKAQGISIGMVMPQNEFNSAQWYPSCVWTPEGLSQFVDYLGPEMHKLGVKVFFGTLERGNAKLFDRFMADTIAANQLNGIGIQWAGKEAITTIHQKYPDLKIYQSEHECGDGSNNWDYFVYGWDLMKHYFMNGASAYMYWNIALTEGGVSHWGWTQNSLISVDKDGQSYHYTYDYYLMKHFSHFIQPGAHLLSTSSPVTKNTRNDVLGWWKGTLADNQANLLAFQNPDQSIVIVGFNKGNKVKNIELTVNDHHYSFSLKAQSLNTMVIR